MIIIGDEGYSILKRTDAAFASSEIGATRKGTSADVMNRQVISKPRELSIEELDDLYIQYRLVQNIVDVFAEDATREWIDFEKCGETFRTNVLQKLNELEARQEFQNVIHFDRLYGDGFMAIGAMQGQKNDIEKPIDESKLIDIEYLNSFSRRKVKDIFKGEDPFRPDYNRVEYIEMRYSGKLYGGISYKVHTSRVLHLQSRKLEGRKWGIPLPQSMLDALQVFDTGFWSLGQALYELTFKVLQSDAVKSAADNMSANEMRALIQREFETNSLALIGKNETLSRITASIPGIKDIFEVIWEVIAMSARMPKAHLMGQQQGTISGSAYDSLNYYARVAGFQENWLRQEIEYIIHLLQKCSKSKVPDEQYTLKFKPLFRLDPETDAKIREIVAKTWKVYVDMGAVTGREVRAMNFKLEALPAILDIDQKELDKLAEEVEKAMKKGEENEEE